MRIKNNQNLSDVVGQALAMAEPSGPPTARAYLAFNQATPETHNLPMAHEIKRINMFKTAIDFLVSFPSPLGNGKGISKMATTVHAYYKGWDIEIRYESDRRSFLRPRRPPKFSAAGVARPHKKANLLEWTDHGPHTLTTGNRVFHCGEEAFKQLMLEMKIFIDSLKR